MNPQVNELKKTPAIRIRTRILAGAAIVLLNANMAFAQQAPATTPPPQDTTSAPQQPATPPPSGRDDSRSATAGDGAFDNGQWRTARATSSIQRNAPYLAQPL